MIEEDRNHARDTVAVNLDKMDYKSNADKVLEAGPHSERGSGKSESKKARPSGARS